MRKARVAVTGGSAGAAGLGGLCPFFKRLWRSDPALKMIAQSFANDFAHLGFIAAAPVLQGVKDFGRKAKRDLFHDHN